MDGEPPQEEDFSQIPLVERSQHKNWKARLSAYNDVIAKSAKTASDTDPFFRPFIGDAGLLKKWTLDANAVAQEKGVEAVLAIVTYSGETSAKLRPEIVPALVDKVLGNSRAGTKKKGSDLCAMFVEVENGGEGVVTDVLVGLGAKQPKTVAGAVTTLKEITEAFGVPALGNVKVLLKALPKIFGHTDKNVRAEGTSLTLALYTYLGPGLMPALAELKPVQVADLQKAFDALDAEGKGKGTGKPTRWTRKAQRDREEAEMAGGGDNGGDGADAEPEPIDPLSLLDPVDVLALFPADLSERLASSKWKDRLESIEECNKVLAQPQNGRISTSNAAAYSSLVQTLGTKCHKDANVNVVMEAAKLLEGLAKGLGKSFGQFRGVTMTGLMERLKERKAAVVEALGKALDAIFLTTTLQDIVEDVLTQLKSKNPQVKEGTLNFLHRSLKATLDAPGKDQVKPMAEALVALLSDSAEPVRTAAAECLGTMMKILGERAFNPFIENVPEIQMAKVKDAFGRAEIKYKVGGVKKPAPKAAAPPAKAPPSARPAVKKPVMPPPSPTKSNGSGSDALLEDIAPPAKAMPARLKAMLAAKAAPKPPSDELLVDEVVAPKRAPPARFTRPLTKKSKDDEDSPTPPASPGPKPALPSPTKAAPPARAAPPKAAAPKMPPPAAAGPSKPAAATGSKPGAAKTLAGSPTDPVKYRYSPEEAAARAEEAIPANYHTALADAAWKVRLEAADEMVKWIGEDGGAEAVDSEIMMRFLGKTPGWGEKNFQVSTKLYQVMSLMAEKSPSFGKPAASLIIGPLTDKLGDLKLKKPAGDALSLCAERTSLAFVLAQSYEPMTKQKAPKAQADALTWIKQQVIDFGIAGIALREFITFIKTALGSPNAAVRSSATALLVQVKVGVGADISGFIEDLNPQLLATINKEFDKVAGQTPPEPTRQQADLKDAPAAGGKGGKGGADPLDDLIPRVDLDKLVASTPVLTDSKSDAWKVRKEAFEALNAVLEVKSNGRLKPNMGEIGTVLKKAMADTNLAVKMLALGIITKIATGMGQPFDKYNRLIVAAVCSVCADQKATTRSAALTTLSAIADACGSLDTMYAGIGASLESTNPALRSSVLGWVGDRLTAEPPSRTADLTPLGAPVIAGLEDRNGDVRKAAGAVLPFVISSAGFDFVMDQCAGLKPASKATIVPLVNAARGAAADAAPAPAAAPAAKMPAAAAGPARSMSIKAPAARAAPGTPRAGSAASVLPKATTPGPGRSLAMKALSSAPSARPASSLSDDRPTGIATKMRLPTARSGSSSTIASIAAPAAASTGRTLPFLTAAAEPRLQRLKRDASRWSLEAAARADSLEYLYTQMEPHTSPDIFTLLFSKDHKAEEDFMASLAVIAEFYDAETSPSFGLPEHEIIAIQQANVDLALKYAAARLLSNNTQLGIRSLEVISNVLDGLARSGERLSETEVKLFVPALVIKLGDAKFGPKLAPIFDGLDKIIPASQVVQLLVQYGLEDKSAGKTCRNESLALIEKTYRKRGSVLRQGDRAFYEVVAKCIADQGTRNAALNLMALLQLQGESRNLTAVIESMPTSSKDMLANRRATLAASKAGAPSAIAPRPKAAGANRLSREIPGPSSGPTSPGPTRPASRGIPAPSTRLPTTSGSSTPSRAIPVPSSLRPASAASSEASGLPMPGVSKRISRLPTAGAELSTNTNGPTRPSTQPLGRPIPAPAAVANEAVDAIEAAKTRDVDDSAEALKKLSMLVEEEEALFVPEAKALLDVLCHQLELTSLNPVDLLEPRSLRRIKHLMRTIHIAFGRAVIVKKFKLQALERLFSGIRLHYALLEVWSENEPEENQQATDLRDYMSMVLSSIIATPSRELVYAMLFDALVDLCRDMTPNQDPRIASEIGVVLQCTYKRVRSIDSDLRNNRIAAGTLLSIIEDLLQVIPPVQWRRRPKYGLPHGDLPLRVVKTLLQRVIVYTKEINVGIYDLLQEQFGAEADMTTVYSYIFRISSAEEAPGPEKAAPVDTGATRRGTNGHERPVSLLSTGKRMSVMPEPPAPPVSKSPTRDVSEAERLVRRLTDTRDSEQRLNELHAFMKSSPENEAEARAAVASILNPAAQTFVWRAIDRRSGEGAEPRSPTVASANVQPSSPIRSPVRELTSPPLSNASSVSGPSRRTSLAPRPSSMAGYDKNAPVDDQLAQLKAVFARTSRTSGSSPTTRPLSDHERVSPTPERPLSDSDPLRAARRPLSELELRKTPTPE
ncbi:hypothetical protein VHUM_02687 [Vanrija humicola]|uniref:TOG domain-containing protein n=1 Tax=Vanrija humicola TaxID=5417 RepID=A0A7D8V009_VANHU|nr:hypothetical protein VHUM_02687 [Vanrija humicola]